MKIVKLDFQLNLGVCQTELYFTDFPWFFLVFHCTNYQILHCIITKTNLYLDLKQKTLGIILTFLEFISNYTDVFRELLSSNSKHFFRVHINQ